MKKKLVALAAALSAVALLAGCTDDASKDISKLNVDKYLVSIGDYKNITVEAEKMEITDDNVEIAINYMLGSAPEKREITGRALEQGDVALIDFAGSIDGVAFEGGTAENQELEIGSGSFIDGFEDALVGMEIDEVRDIDVTFPADYPATELAGKPAVFKVTLHKIYEKYIPDLTEEYVAGLGLEGVNTVDDFKAEVRKQLEETVEQEYNDNLETLAMDELLNICEFTEEVPAERYQYYYDSMVNAAMTEAQQYGLDFDSYVKQLYGYETTEAFYSEVEDAAIRATHLDLAAAKITKLEKIKFSNADVKKSIEEHCAEFGCQSADEFLAQYDIDDYKSYLINEKATEVILNNINAVAPTEDSTTETAQ